MVADEKVEQLLERITALENRVDELEQEKTSNLKQENQQLREENKRLRAKLRWYEGPHTPPSRTTRPEGRPRPMRTRTTNSHVLTVGHRVESPDTTLSGEPHLTQIEKSTLPVTAVRVWRRVRRVGGRQPRLVEEPRSTATRSYTVQPPSLRVLLFVEPRLSLHTRLPRRGAVRGERHRPPLFPDTITASPTGRSPTASSNCMASNSQVHLRGATERARAPVGVNTNRSADGFSTLTLFTSTRRESNATANRRGCGRSPRTSTRCTRSERVAEAMFRQKSSARTSRGTVVCDGWTAYPAFTSNLQRCWAHILREAEDVATSTRTESQFTGISRKCTSVSSRGWRPTRAFT